jgi:rubredoxin
VIHFLNSHDFPTVNTFATVPMIMHCPMCNRRHIDEGEFAEKPHHTHACQHCGHVWRPALLNTHGVRYLPGFKGSAAPPPEREKPRCTVCRRDGFPQAQG